MKTPYAGSLWGGVALGDDTARRRHARQPCAQPRRRPDLDAPGRSPAPARFTAAAALPDGGAALVGADGTLAVAPAGSHSFRLHRLEDRATLTGAVSLPSGQLAVATMAGMRIVDPRAGG